EAGVLQYRVPCRDCRYVLAHTAWSRRPEWALFGQASTPESSAVQSQVRPKGKVWMMTERTLVRLSGVLGIIIGVAMLVVVLKGLLSDWPSVVLALSVVGPVMVWVSIGAVIDPPPNIKRMKLRDDVGKWLGGLPPFWRVWYPLTLVVIFAALVC